MVNPMSSQASPDTVPNRAGVRRVNNLPIFIVVGIMLVFLLTMMIVAMNRANQQNQVSSDDNSKAGSSHSLAQLITGEFEAETIIPPTDQFNLEQPIIERPNNLDMPPLPPGAHKMDEEPITPDNSHIYQMKMQLFEEAVKAKTNVGMVASRSAGSAPKVPIPVLVPVLVQTNPN